MTDMTGMLAGIERENHRLLRRVEVNDLQQVNQQNTTTTVFTVQHFHICVF